MKKNQYYTLNTIYLWKKKIRRPITKEKLNNEDYELRDIFEFVRSVLLYQIYNVIVKR